MGLGSRAWRALMRRNLIYRKRNWIGSLLELFLPIAFVGILVAIKNAVEGSSGFSSETIPPVIPDENYTFTPLSFTDYVTAMRATRQCQFNETTSSYSISGIDQQGYNWQVPFVKCNSRLCEFDGQDAQPFCEYGKVAVSPSSTTDEGGKERAATFQQWIYDSWPELTNTSDIMPFDFEFVEMFNDPGDMDNYVQSENYGTSESPKLIMGVVWQGNSPTDYAYSLRQNSTNFNAAEEAARPGVQTTPNTGQEFDSFAKNDMTACVPQDGVAQQGPLENSCTGQYLYNGILTFQRLVGDFILQDTGAKDITGTFVAQSGVAFVQFPAPAYETSGFFDNIRTIAPLLIILGLLYPVAAMIGYVTKEKELRQKELMKMMSVTESDIGWSWFVSFYMFYIVIASCVFGVSTKLYTFSAPIYLWSFWILTFLAFVVFAMLVSTFTSKSTRAVLIGLLVFFMGVFLTLAVDYQEGNSGVIGILSLHPVTAFSYGLQEIGRLEDQSVGLQSNTVGETDSPSGYTFNQCLTSLIIDSILWGIVTWYLNRVIRPDYGQALPWYFPFTASYWCPSKAKAPKSTKDVEEEIVDEGAPIEPVGDNLKAQGEEGKNIEIHRLTKTFGEKTAVDELSLSMYSGQITALLGHNGAGKTTTINMLTGAMAPTDGYATVLGKDIRTQMQEIRQDVGICLQHDCLFPKLTVREHVQFFSRVKGLYDEMTKDEAEAHVGQAIQDVALSEKSNSLSSNLSGGMKRKLSVAIAFCGGSKVVMLDEPTSGMDPFSRRFTWNVIRQYRQDRVIILTTHFMDEADILGDRIAIMAEGRLRCVGSALFLKKRYGVGYQLTIEKASGQRHSTIEPGNDSNGGTEGEPENEVPQLASGTHAHDEKLMEIVTGAVSEASLLTNVGSEMAYQLPMGAASKFGPMFEGLDQEMDLGEIKSYGVGITTLDEVFLLVARGEDTSPESKKAFASSKLSADGTGAIALAGDADKSARSRMDLENEGLFARHVGALFKKRAAYFRRDKKAWVCTSIVPSLFVLIGFIIFTFASPNRNLEPLTLDLSYYNPDVKEAPRNPIPFNNPGSEYTCQPGICAYQTPVVSETVLVNGTETQELYYFCGAQAFLLDEPSCTIDESSEVVGRITQYGASPEPADVETIDGSSISLVNTSDAYLASQYGAIWYTHEIASTIDGNGTSFNETVVEQCVLAPGDYSNPANCSNFGGIGYVLQYNFTALHVSPLYQTLADEALIRNAFDDDNFTISTVIAPLPITKVEQSFGASEDAFSAWFLIVLSFPFISGAFATFVVNERETKAKHLQTVAGVEPSAYWLATYAWDIMNYQIPCWITVMLMFAFDIEVLTTTENGVVGGIITLLVLFGPASAGFSYCMSFMFTSASLCNVVIILLGFLIGMGGALTTFILILIGSDPSDPKDNLILAADIITWILRFIPSFNLAKGLYNAINIEAFEFVYGKELSVWTEEILLYEVIFLAWQSVVYILLAIQIDKWSTNPRAVSYWRNFVSCITCNCLCCKSKVDQADEVTLILPDDDDVIAEQDRVLGGEANSDLIVMSQLTKVYADGNVVAVNNMSLGIPTGECFGLLGINGAGKTTTMQMLTAEFPPTSGDATLAGYSVSNEPEKTRRRIGYCPQFDAHFANLTGREHVELYASIKGVPKEFVKEAAAAKLEQVGLSKEDSDRLCAQYSGGMKRRLSLACAMIGQPQIVFLDEASTGVDPVARREIWQLISDMVAGSHIPDEEKTSVILTTHSMEECEALCPRIGIMANGRLRCLGSAQHLKSKFGQGYQVELKVKLVDHEDQDYLDNVAAIMRSKTVPAEGAEGDEETPPVGETFFTLPEAREAARTLSTDYYLSNMINPGDPKGYMIFKAASSPVGVSIDELAAFATIELRQRNLETWVKETYPDSVLRERQDTKSRYEVNSKDIKISSIFAAIEENKERLMLSDYGVSQTSLEQVFNMHAAQAEELKHGHVVSLQS